MNEFADYLPQEFQERIAFFHEHAGWSYNPATETPEAGRQRSAERLAVAELLIERAGAAVTWHEDWSLGTTHAHYYCDEAYPDGGPETCEFATLDLDGKVLATVGCIDDADEAYRRVIAAELALDALIAAAETAVTVSELGSLLAGNQLILFIN